MATDDIELIRSADTFFLGTTHLERGNDASHRGACLVEPPGAGQRLHPPEGAHREGRFLAGELIRRRLDVVAVDKAVGDQLRGDRVQKSVEPLEEEEAAFSTQGMMLSSLTTISMSRKTDGPASGPQAIGGSRSIGAFERVAQAPLVRFRRGVRVCGRPQSSGLRRRVKP